MTRIKRSLKAYPFSFAYCLFVNYSMWLGIEPAFFAFLLALPVNGVFYWYWFSTSYDLDSKSHQIIKTNWHGQKTSIPIIDITTEVKPVAFGAGHLLLEYRHNVHKLKNITQVSAWKKRIDVIRWERQALLDDIKANIKRSDKILAKMNRR
ncbi:MAG: hypothetical protein RPR91_03285 [Colwellia sp.]